MDGDSVFCGKGDSEVREARICEENNLSCRKPRRAMREGMVSVRGREVSICDPLQLLILKLAADAQISPFKTEGL